MGFLHNKGDYNTGKVARFSSPHQLLWNKEYDPSYFTVYFKTCHVKKKLPLILHYKSTLHLIFAFNDKLLVCRVVINPGQVLIWHSAPECRIPHLLCILPGDSRGGGGLFPPTHTHWLGREESNSIFRLSIFSCTVTQQYSSCKQCIYNCVY